MNKSPLITVVNNENMRGVIAPTRIISQKLLEDIIDLVELSSPEVIKETARRIKKANRKKAWIPLKKASMFARGKFAKSLS